MEYANIWNGNAFKFHSMSKSCVWVRILPQYTPWKVQHCVPILYTYFTLRLPPTFCRLAEKYTFFHSDLWLPDGLQACMTGTLCYLCISMTLLLSAAPLIPRAQAPRHRFTPDILPDKTPNGIWVSIYDWTKPNLTVLRWMCKPLHYGVSCFSLLILLPTFLHLIRFSTVVKKR